MWTFFRRLLQWLGLMAGSKVSIPTKKDIDDAIEAHDANPNAHGGLTGNGTGEVSTAQLEAKAQETLNAAKADATAKDTQVATAAATTAQQKVDAAKTELQTAIDTKLTVPPSGLGYEQMSAGIKASLNKADSAVQSGTAVTSVNGQTGDVVIDDTGSPVGDASSTTKGLVKLPGGTPGVLGGTADVPVVDGWDLKADKTTVNSSLAGKVDTTDARLTNSRTPTGHHASHEAGGSDALDPTKLGLTSENMTFTSKPELQIAATKVQQAIEVVQSNVKTVKDNLAASDTAATALGQRVANAELDIDGIQQMLTVESGGASFQPVFTEDFSSGSVDTTKWSVLNNVAGSNGDGTRLASNVVVAAGNLELQGSANNISGLLMRTSYRYGRYEFRARIDKAKGYAWVIGLYPQSNNIADGAIDIVSLGGARATGLADKNAVNVKYNTTQADTNEQSVDVSQWHVFAIDWLANRISVFIDGLKVYETTDAAKIQTYRCTSLRSLRWA